MDGAGRTKRSPFTLLTSLAVALVLVVVVSVLYLRLDRRHSTTLAWAEAQAVSDVLVGSGRWRVTVSMAPCRDADPEAFTELLATEPGSKPLAEVKSVVSGWQEIGSEDASSFGARSSDGRVLVVVDKSSEVLTAEVSVAEVCR